MSKEKEISNKPAAKETKPKQTKKDTAKEAETV